MKRWHLPQVVATLARYSVERSSPARNTPWAPWQLAQRRRDQEPRLVQAVSVRGIGVAVPLLFVTLAAGLDLMVDEDRRTAVVGRQDSMLVLAVTLAAVEHRAAALLVFLARMGVDAHHQSQPLLLVADGAHLPRAAAPRKPLSLAWASLTSVAL